MPPLCLEDAEADLKFGSLGAAFPGGGLAQTDQAFHFQKRLVLTNSKHICVQGFSSTLLGPLSHWASPTAIRVPANKPQVCAT